MRATAIKNGVLMALCSASSAFAATGVREDNSDIIIWVFLGFCALIVVAQLIPAFVLLLGFIKAFVKRPAPQTESAPTPPEQ